MSNGKQTAVDWLSDKIVEILGDKCNDLTTEQTLRIHYALKQAKAIEKQQIVEAYVEGHSLCRCVTDNTEEAKESSEQYYSQKYKQ